MTKAQIKKLILAFKNADKASEDHEAKGRDVEDKLEEARAALSGIDVGVYQIGSDLYSVEGDDWGERVTVSIVNIVKL